MGKHQTFNFLFLSFIVIAVLNACSTEVTGDNTGVLKLSIQGLSTLKANITVTGPNSFNQSIKANRKLENLAAGSYTITAQDVVQTDTYFPDIREQSIEVKAGETASIILTYRKQSASAGSLEVTINGLPADTNADVVISNSSGFSQQLTTSSVLSNLAPGDYQLTAKTVEVGSDTYIPTPTSQTIGVAEGSKTDLGLTYSKQLTTVGQLAITITGLPTDYSAAVFVTGPNEFSETLTASKTFSDLPPGEYIITASKVDGTYPYNPTPKTQTLNVVAVESTDALLAYVPTIPLPNAAEGAAFGFDVAVDGDLMVVGAPFETSGTVKNAGFVYVYVRSSTGEWQFVKRLAPAPLLHFEKDSFGISVAVNGDKVVVGSPNTLTNRECDLKGNCIDQRGGAVYVFERNQGGQNNFGLVAPLVASDFYSDSDDFGSAVTISGNIIVVGAPEKAVDLDKDGTIDCSVTSTECSVGEAYIFAEAEATKTWREMKKLFASDAASGEHFGEDVSISGNTVVIGAPRDDYDADGDEYQPDTGAAYIFQRDEGGAGNWGQVKKRVASDGVKYDYFGNSIAISGDLVVVSISSEETRSEVPIYVFQRDHGGANQWGEVKTLKVDSLPGYLYTSVAVRGDTVLVGAPYASHDVNEDGTIDCFLEMGYTGSECFTGAVSVFGQNEGGANNFGLVKRFVAIDGAGNDGLGFGLALNDESIIVSAPGHAKRTGAVYVLEP